MIYIFFFIQLTDTVYWTAKRVLYTLYTTSTVVTFFFNKLVLFSFSGVQGSCISWYDIFFYSSNWLTQFIGLQNVILIWRHIGSITYNRLVFVTCLNGSVLFGVSGVQINWISCYVIFFNSSNWLTQCIGLQNAKFDHWSKLRYGRILQTLVYTCSNGLVLFSFSGVQGSCISWYDIFFIHPINWHSILDCKKSNSLGVSTI